MARRSVDSRTDSTRTARRRTTLATVALSPRRPFVTDRKAAVVAANTKLAVLAARVPTRTRTATRTVVWAARAARRPARARSRRGRARAARSLTRSRSRRSARRAARQSPTTYVCSCSNLSSSWSAESNVLTWFVFIADFGNAAPEERQRAREAVQPRPAASVTRSPSRTTELPPSQRSQPAKSTSSNFFSSAPSPGSDDGFSPFGATDPFAASNASAFGKQSSFATAKPSTEDISSMLSGLDFTAAPVQPVLMQNSAEQSSLDPAEDVSNSRVSS